ncbi:MAG TPA: histidine phosphatase family protein [Gemmatimonadales bacterium]|jgi:phosphohistidine phosphatase|nr:histidine phosphatase family protein [Gemmatimonadales bacterium]
MLILLIRHAIAAEQDPKKYPDDTLRPLLAKGRRIQARMSQRLRKEGLAPDRVFSSRWKRAWQTARIVVDETGIGKTKRFGSPALAEPPDLSVLAAEIGPVSGTERIALVGHEPWMGSLASLLLAGSAGALTVDFPKSGIMGIEAALIEAGVGQLQFFWRP